MCGTFWTPASQKGDFPTTGRLSSNVETSKEEVTRMEKTSVNRPSTKESYKYMIGTSVRCGQARTREMTHEDGMLVNRLRIVRHLLEKDGRQGCRKDLLMVFNTIANESYRHHFASPIGCELSVKSNDPEMLIDYMQCIAEFGFDHIIFLGEMYYGMAFLDQYSRMFQLGRHIYILQPLGNSLEEAKLTCEQDDRLIWFV
ncbi:hypothetical protein G9A89_017304 [Geosiphon pyriformis]|nr:hypothetical protein G9A89_017304 [Geosiphon pyriformis]